jgi:DUF1009 family protein
MEQTATTGAVRRVATLLAHCQAQSTRQDAPCVGMQTLAANAETTPLVLVAPQGGGVVVVQLNRPKSLNALGTDVRALQTQSGLY